MIVHQKKTLGELYRPITIRVAANFDDTEVTRINVYTLNEK